MHYYYYYKKKQRSRHKCVYTNCVAIVCGGAGLISVKTVIFSIHHGCHGVRLRGKETGLTRGFSETKKHFTSEEVKHKNSGLKLTRKKTIGITVGTKSETTKQKRNRDTTRQQTLFTSLPSSLFPSLPFPHSPSLSLSISPLYLPPPSPPLTGLQPGAEAGGEVLQRLVHLGGAGQPQQAGQQRRQRLDEQPGALLVRLLVAQQLERQGGGAQGAVARAVARRLLLLVRQRHVVGADVRHVGAARVLLRRHGVLVARVELRARQVLLLDAGEPTGRSTTSL